MNNKFIYDLKNRAIQITSLGQIINTNIYQNYNFVSEVLPEGIMKQILKFYNNESVETREVSILDRELRLSLNSADINRKPCFLFFKLICTTKTKIFINALANTSCKLWMNSKIIAGSTFWFSPLVSIKVEKGDNIFIIELPEATSESFLEIRINKYVNEIKDDYVSILGSNYTISQNIANLLYNKIELYDKDLFEYILIPNDNLNIDIMQDVTLKLIERFPWNIVSEQKCKFNIKYTVDTSLQEYKNADNLNNIVYQFEYYNKAGTLCYTWAEQFFYPIDKAVDSIKKQAEKLLYSDSITEYDKLALEFHLNYYKKHAINHTSKFYNTHELKTAINYSNDEKHHDQLIYAEGFRKKYYRSNIDDCVDIYHVYVPKNYDKNKKYPLFITMSTGVYSWDASLIGQYTKETLIAVDISGRGVTLGSYVAESAFWEAMDDIIKVYSIDEKRIFLTGTSSGGAAVWAQSQAYPHEFAGIFTIAGPVDEKHVGNVNNLRIINVSSKYEHLYDSAFARAHKRLKQNTKYTGILADNMIHNDLAHIRCKEAFIDDMLRYHRESWPNHISYITERNRHRKAYWFEIDSIKFGKKSSKIQAYIKNNTIFVNVINVSGFTITLPPQINKNEFKIEINKKYTMTYYNYKQDKIHIRRKSKDYIMDEKLFPCDLRKGLGLLDVYLKPMRIIIPDKNNKTISNIASTFSKPSTNGFETIVYVEYPIIKIPDRIASIEEISLIIIDANYNHPFFNEVRALCPIKTDSTGFEYKSNRKNTDYCIMQMIQNPNNTNFSILYINYNKERLAERNLFTRKVVLPTYMNGVHPYTNNMALIFDGKRYFKIYEWGMDMEKIK